jgi:5-methylcytosine-specific restriction endonuclease McrA
MFTEKATVMLGGLKGLRFRKEDVTINMVLAINTYNQIPENIVVLLKEKNLTKTRRLIGKRRKSFNIHLKKLLKTCNRKNLQGIYLEP